jgi:hypothetical protein
MPAAPHQGRGDGEPREHGGQQLALDGRAPGDPVVRASRCARAPRGST